MASLEWRGFRGGDLLGEGAGGLGLKLCLCSKHTVVNSIV